MSELKPKESTPFKELIKTNTPKTSTSNVFHSSSVSTPLVPMPEKEDLQDAEGMKRSLRQMGILPPRPVGTKKGSELWELSKPYRMSF